jgi:hypothetical protein
MLPGFSPFFVFIAILGRANFLEVAGTNGRWRSFFASDEATNKLLLATWLTSITDGGLHAISFFLDLYLLIMFRKISNLPPDMNPLEDNLTSRRKSKHKYKNSSAVEINDKHLSEMTSSTVRSSNRTSQAQEPLINDSKNSGFSFFKSRTNENDSFSPHNPTTARLSQASLARPSFQQSSSARNSRVDLDLQEQRPGLSRITSSMPANPTISKRSSVVTTVPVFDDGDESQYAESAVDKADGGNWAVLGQDDDLEKTQDYDPYRTISDPASVPRKDLRYQTLGQHSPQSNIAPQPLGMNPPTPDARYTRFSPVEDDKENGRTETMQSAASALSASSTYSTDETVVSSSTGKTRFYGDLAAAMRGVRQHEVISPRPTSMVGSVHNASELSEYSLRGPRTSHARPSLAAAGDRRVRPKSFVDSVSGTVIRKPMRSGDEPEQLAPYLHGNREGESPRVVSRTGVDMSVGADLGLGQGRREVSGKVAEEGRSGYRSGMFMRRVSGLS